MTEEEKRIMIRLQAARYFLPDAAKEEIVGWVVRPRQSLGEIFKFHLKWLLGENASINEGEAADSFAYAYGDVFGLRSTYDLSYLRRMAGDLLRGLEVGYVHDEMREAIQKLCDECFLFEGCLFGAISFQQQGETRYCLTRKATLAQLESHENILRAQEDNLRRSLNSFSYFWRDLRNLESNLDLAGVTCEEILVKAAESVPVCEGLA